MDVYTFLENMQMSVDFLLNSAPSEKEIDLQKIAGNIMKRSDLLDIIKSKLNYRIEKECVADHPQYLNGASQVWQKLSDEYKCMICFDVLAAPTILDCSHNICGICSEVLLINYTTF